MKTDAAMSALGGAMSGWDEVYRTKEFNAVSWYAPHLDVSLALLEQAGVAPCSRVIDVGGGASTLVDDLLARGICDITVVDLSAEALEVSRRRLGQEAASVHWQLGDIRTLSLPQSGFDYWHDRAVLHFLTDEADALAYSRQAASAVALGGHAVIGGFAPDGPARCSGLDVARRGEQEIRELFAPAFTAVSFSRELHRTPGGQSQAFLFALLRRV